MKKSPIYLIANGDQRLSANRSSQPGQTALEESLTAAIEREGFSLVRAHPFDDEKGHGFIDSQKYGIEVFRGIPGDAPLIVAEAVWQYSHHVLAGLIGHRGPILTLANFSGSRPGLVGLLNLNASLTKAGVGFSSLWGEDFDDETFRKKLRSWLRKGTIRHDLSHVTPYRKVEIPPRAEKSGQKFAKALRRDRAILGVFDEGCMGMYNAIIPDELLAPLGVFKERLSQSALFARMRRVSDDEARAAYSWLLKRGMTFHLGADEATELTEHQVLQQLKMYVAAVRMADEFGCAAIGIQYQLGLIDLTPASDLAEGLLNNCERPPVYREGTDIELFVGEALPHFNEVDECAGLDALITYHLWRQLDLPPETTLHDLRWARTYSGPSASGRHGHLDADVWVLLISGAAPPEHFIDGFAGSTSERQPQEYFPLGGGTLKGISKPGWVVWSRVYIEGGKLCFDTGLAEVVDLPREETEDRWQNTTPHWPIMHLVFKDISRDQMMARHKSNHIQVAYAHSKAGARRAMFAKAVAMHELGLEVFFCGKI